jgi:hypothetical protein
LQTSFSTASYPTLNSTNNFSGTDIKQLIASLRDGSTILNGGYLSEIYVLDGIAIKLLKTLENLMRTQEYGNLSLTQVLMELMDSI